MRVFAIEGLDFSGKTSTCSALMKILLERNVNAIYVKEPDVSSIIGRKIYDGMLNGRWGEMSPFEYAGMFAASRLESRIKLLSLKEDLQPDVVILDRCELSTMVYQTICLRMYAGKVETFDLQKAERLLIEASKLSGSMLKLDRVFYLDTPVHTCLERLAKCENPDKNETPDKIKMSHSLYHNFISENHFNVTKVPTTGFTPDIIAHRVLSEMKIT